MANPERGEVSVDVDGAMYTLRPTFDSLCELEDLVGKPLQELLQSILQGRLSSVRAVVWCLLQDQHASQIKVLKDASQWIERAGGVSAVMPMVNRALELNAPEEEGHRDRPRKAQAGTGARSSRRRAKLA